VYTDDTDDKEEGANLLRTLIAWYYVRRDIIPYLTVEGDINIARLQVGFEKIAAHLTENEHKAAEDARKRKEENNTFRDFAKRMLKEAETKDPALALRVKEIADQVADDHGVGRFLQIETE
jgi:5'-3' exonuclease